MKRLRILPLIGMFVLLLVGNAFSQQFPRPFISDSIKKLATKIVSSSIYESEYSSLFKAALDEINKNLILMRPHADFAFTSCLNDLKRDFRMWRDLSLITKKHPAVQYHMFSYQHNLNDVEKFVETVVETYRQYLNEETRNSLSADPRIELKNLFAAIRQSVLNEIKELDKHLEVEKKRKNLFSPRRD